MFEGNSHLLNILDERTNPNYNYGFQTDQSDRGVEIEDHDPQEPDSFNVYDTEDYNFSLPPLDDKEVDSQEIQAMVESVSQEIQA